MYVLAAMFPVFQASILYHVQSEVVNTQEPQATVSESVTVNAEVCVHHLKAKLAFQESTDHAINCEVQTVLAFKFQSRGLIAAKLVLSDVIAQFANSVDVTAQAAIWSVVI
jgi:hypothetical protein